MDARTMALLAQGAYHSDPVVGPWVRRGGTRTIHVYRRADDPGVEAIAYRGTEVSDLDDVMTDLELMAAGGMGSGAFWLPVNAALKDRVQEAVAFARTRVRPGVRLVHVGHSLGGTCALRAAYVAGGIANAFAPYVPVRLPWNQLRYRPGMTVYGNRVDPIMWETMLDRNFRLGSGSARWRLISEAGQGPTRADQMGHGLGPWTSGRAA